ncbi:hypothetical protein SISSUDRAFT_846883 [Sistotremastrum suecicum HHB10207 ss-3]|uniref:Fibronectin type-III domain-containing protein n=1 Tax=Sistotremastrum suecicum HHB10207 ss-3 TaxID=1314776 RepID=A0A166HJT5_9AGAM|nr:hypothetical protein SISSUDRAFT_846883 [Sistotremastrum suecicum HHB10207 ss-3]
MTLSIPIGSWLSLLQLACLVSAFTPSKWIDQSFYFSWSAPSDPFTIPITAQCDVIEITWARQTATGPDPVAPFYLQIYTSNYIVPFVIPAGSGESTNFTVPFAPGTQYQICMIDSNGATGGCQAIYTVYPANTTDGSTPVCANMTFPTTNLNVTSLYPLGTLSQYGWPGQCGDLSVKPQEGTPPFTFTVSPALHPPLNITSSTMDAINWTISLSWGSPFFISLVDSSGLSWTNGPLHSGTGPTDCLSLATPSHQKTTPWFVSLGTGFGGLLVGALLAFLVPWFLERRRRDNPVGVFTMGEDEYQPIRHEYYNSMLSSGGTLRTSRSRGSGYDGLSNYDLEPLQYPRTSAHESVIGVETISGTQVPNISTSSAPPTASDAAGPSALSADNRSGSHVYVVHHDGGRPPVSVYAPQGTEVVELPPEYAHNPFDGPSSPSSSRRPPGGSNMNKNLPDIHNR